MKKSLCLLLLSLIANTVFGFNFGEIKTFCRNFAHDNSPDPAKWHFSDVLISSYVNAGQQAMVNATFCLEGTTTYTIVSGQREYNFSADMIAIQRVTLDGVLLEQKSIVKLDEDTSWESNLSSSTPSFYYIQHTTYSVIGFDVLPTTTTYTKMKVRYTKKATQLVSSSDIPFDGQERLESYQWGLVWWTVALLCYQDNRESDGDRFMILYQKYERDMVTGIGINPNYVPSQSAPSRNIIGQ